MAGDLKVSIRKLINASERYVENSVKKANASGPRTLSQTEAKKLPKDLRDNFANFRERTTPNGSVQVKEFTQSFKAYVEANARRADTNGDGYLTKADSKKLPADLRDNFLNFYRAIEMTGSKVDAKAGYAVKTTAKAEYVYTNECDNQSVLKVNVKLPNGKKVDVEIRNPKWAGWDDMEKGDAKTFKLEGRVILNKDLRDMSALSQGSPADMKESEKAWNDLFKDTTHFLDTNMTEGIFVVDKMIEQ
jgi:hypothetical protein